MVEQDGLDPRSDSSVIEQGTSLELPYWIMKVILEEDAIAIEMPKVYSELYRDIFKADATVVDLHKLSKYFYEFGKLLSFIKLSDSQELCNTLIQTFIDRYRLLSDWAHSSSSNVDIAEKLDSLERSLLNRGKISCSNLTSWLAHGVGKIATAELVNTHRKRKLLAQQYNVQL